MFHQYRHKYTTTKHADAPDTQSETHAAISNPTLTRLIRLDMDIDLL